MSSFFVTGGTMKPDAPCYVHRAADEELYNALLAGEYCSVLTTRQMGKSSLMARTAVRLREQGIRCATVDLQGKGEKNPPPEQWYYGILKQIADGLGISPDWADWWKKQGDLLPAQRMTEFFADVVLQEISGRTVVFIDEVDWMIRLTFSDEFFAVIRSCYNKRATAPEFDRISIVLLGSAAPAQLIRDTTRTPFNIGHAIELTDFTQTEAGRLAQALGPDGEAILSRILDWTDGHPYLTQMLCAKVAEQNRKDATADALVDQVVHETLLSTSARLQENNLKFVGDRLTQATSDLRKVLLLYLDVVHRKPVRDMPASPIHTSLRLSGIVKPDAERRLQVRNRIYLRVFDERWVREKMPMNVRLFTISAAAIILITTGSLLYWFAPTQVHYREYAYVTNGDSNTVSVIDLRGLRLLKTIPVGRSPTGVTANPRRNEIYVINTESDTISVIEAETNSLAATIGVHRAPFFVDVSGDGTRAYVANSGSGDLSVIDLDRREVIKTIQVGNGSDLAKVTLSGKLVVISLRKEDAIALVDTETLTLRSKIKTCSQPGDFVILPDSSKAFVACFGSNELAVVDLTNDRLLTLLDVDPTPIQVALTPDSGEIFVCNFASSSVAEIITRSNEVNKSFLIGDRPVRGLVSSDNSLLFVTNFGSDSVAVYSINDGRRLDSVWVGSRPEAMAFSPNQLLLLVVDTGSNDLAILRLKEPGGATKQKQAILETMVPVGVSPRAIAVKAFVSRL